MADQEAKYHLLVTADELERACDECSGRRDRRTRCLKEARERIELTGTPLLSCRVETDPTDAGHGTQGLVFEPVRLEGCPAVFSRIAAFLRRLRDATSALLFGASAAFQG